MVRQNVDSGTSWEAIAGYSRAVRVGDQVFVSGTTAHDANGELHGGDDAYTQAVYVLKKINVALAQVGASLDDVVRTRVYVVHLADWREVARAHREVFGASRPAHTLRHGAVRVDGWPPAEIEAA